MPYEEEVAEVVEVEGEEDEVAEVVDVGEVGRRFVKVRRPQQSQQSQQRRLPPGASQPQTQTVRVVKNPQQIIDEEILLPFSEAVKAFTASVRTLVFECEPEKPCRPERLVIDTTQTPHMMILDELSFGMDRMQAALGGVSVRGFSPLAVGTRLTLPKVQKRDKITIKLSFHGTLLESEQVFVNCFFIARK